MTDFKANFGKAARDYAQHRAGDGLHTHWVRGADVAGFRDHVHIDLDVLDPVESPGVSHPEANGLGVSTVLELLRYLLKAPFESLSVSISEYNPARDANNVTLGIAQRFVEAIGAACQDDTKQRTRD